MCVGGHDGGGRGGDSEGSEGDLLHLHFVRTVVRWDTGEVRRDESLLGEDWRVLFGLVFHGRLEKGYIGSGGSVRVVKSRIRMTALSLTIGWFNGGWRTERVSERQK
jgi:hypothetical protein